MPNAQQAVIEQGTFDDRLRFFSGGTLNFYSDQNARRPCGSPHTSTFSSIVVEWMMASSSRCWRHFGASFMQPARCWLPRDWAAGGADDAGYRMTGLGRMTTSAASTKARRWLKEISIRYRLPTTRVWLWGTLAPSNTA